jgi:hypothetical protein
LIVERTPWTPGRRSFQDTTLVPVRIGFHAKELQEQAKAAQGKWDPKKRAWFIQFGKIKRTELEKLIIL